MDHRRSVYEAAGGEDAILALARAWHARCFAAALDDARIPADDDLRDTLVRWFAWSNRLVNHRWAAPADVPDDLRLPRWSWDGPVEV